VRRIVPAVLFALTASVAAAQPPAVTPPPQLVIAKVSNGSLVWPTTDIIPVTAEKTVTVIRNGQQVTEKVTVTEYQSVTKQVSQRLKDLRATDGAGRPVAPDALGERLGKGSAVVLHTGPLPEAFRRLFRDDTVLVELLPPSRP
jgi:hypothetical protein